MAEITVDEIRDWLRHPVTKEFMLRIKDSVNEEDAEVHGYLKQSTINQDAFYQAALANAGKTRLEEVLLIPEYMIDELKEE